MGKLKDLSWYSRLAMTESELALAEQKCNDYSVIISRLKQELADSSTVHQSDIRREREVCHLVCCPGYMHIHFLFFVVFFSQVLRRYSGVCAHKVHTT